MSNLTNSAKLEATGDDRKIAVPCSRICRAADHAVRSLMGAVGIVGGGLIWHYADALMLRRIYLIGEENALGRDNVIRFTDGSALLTNPGAMMYYALPFLGGAVFLIVLGSWLWYREYKAILERMRGR